ncbi:MAG TPA: UDP-N-acetylmuramate dehydrogenase [Gammaproteobacteria bacterium]|nr:UDP-N-acetylmuramate dehydrogenase [Gammaproteobacteria bacterium]
MNSPFTLTPNASLLKHNTFRVPARAVWLAEVNNADALPELLALPEVRGKPLLVLGDGSNVLFTRDFDGLVIIVAAHGIEILEDDGASVRIHASAGENWNGLVRWTLSQDLCGLENLSLIPGRVGAAPIQNIGAYGAELAETLVSVEAFDRTMGKSARLTREQCGFRYRDSIFKQQPERWIITSVELRLHHSAPLKLDYAGVREELAAMGIAQPTATNVADAVCRLRLRKLPDPAVIGNAGSFFKNPIVSNGEAEKLQVAHPGLPVFNAPDGKKLSAAWLIERCGWKGRRDGDAGVSEKHALVLVNHGKATGAQIWLLAQRIRDSVQGRFGITLEPEPRVL